jgi:hypothetical protein
MSLRAHRRKTNEQGPHEGADFLLHHFRGTVRINEPDALWPSAKLDKIPEPNAIVKGQVTAFITVRGPIPANGGSFRGHIENDGEIGPQTAGGELADRPEKIDVEAIGVALVNDVGQQEAVADNDLSSFEGRLNDFADKLGPAGHEEQSLAVYWDLLPMVEQDAAKDLAERRAAGIDASGDGETALAQPVGEEPTLGRFTSAIQAIQGNEKTAGHGAWVNPQARGLSTTPLGKLTATWS